MEYPENLVIFDGECNFCNSTVNSLISKDKKKVLSYSPSESNFAKNILSELHLENITSETIVLIHEGEVIIKSNAAIMILRLLGFPYNLSCLFYIIPRFIRDSIYAFIAKNRRKIIRNHTTCVIPDEETKKNFYN